MRSLVRAIVCFACVSAFGFKKVTAYDFDGFVDIDSKTSLYAKVKRGDPGAPVIVMLNGLTQDTEHWKTVAPILAEKKATIIEIDLALQGRSLVKRVDKMSTWLRPILKPLVVFGGVWDQEPVLPATSIEDQASNVIKVLQQLVSNNRSLCSDYLTAAALRFKLRPIFPRGLKKRFSLHLTLSHFRSKIRLYKNGEVYEGELSAVAFCPDDNLYDIILRGIVVTTYPAAEPEIMRWRPPYQAFGASELVRGIRHMEYRKLFEHLQVPLHLVVAGKDTYVPRDKLDEFWGNVPADFRGSFMEVKGVEHKVNEAVGPFLARGPLSSRANRNTSNAREIFWAFPKKAWRRKLVEIALSSWKKLLRAKAGSRCQNFRLR